MKKQFVTVFLVLLIGTILFGTATVSAEGPDIDRCMEYLYPYTAVEWTRCIGDEFNKFPDVSEALRDAYIHAPSSGQWPGAERIYLGENAPYVNLPQSSRADTGYVYTPPANAGKFTEPVLTNQTPTFDGSWWQQPEQPVQVPSLQTQEVDVYTAWQNYWMSGGVTEYGGWEVPGGYTVPPW